MLDGGGMSGEIFLFTFAAATFGSALLAFFYFWRKGQLNLDESPKFEMMQQEEDHES